MSVFHCRVLQQLHGFEICSSPKSKMFAYIKRHCLYDVSIGAMREPGSCQEKYDWLNDNDRAYGTMCLDIPPTMCYLLDSADYPFDLWRNIDEAIGMQQEYESYMERKKMGTSLCILHMVLTSCISQEAVQNEEEEVAKYSSNDPTQDSSSGDSSSCQEAMFHEESILVSSITTVEYLSIHSTPFSSMSFVMNREYVLLVDVHSEPSL